MTTKIDPRQPPGVTSPIYRDSSSTVKSPTPAGGEVPVSDYANKAPAPIKREFLR
jgi:hypothetical protein